MSGRLVRNLRDADVPILRNSEVEFLELLNSEIETIVSTRQCCNASNNEAIVRLVTTLEDNFDEIIRNLTGGRTSRQQFCSAYPKWKKCREDGIKQLEDIAKSIDTDRHNCNVSKIVGYSTSLIGGAITLASAFAVPLTLGIATPLFFAGVGMTASGVSTSFGTSVVETGLLKNKVNKAQKILRKDKKYFSRLNEWLQHAKDLQEALEAVMNTDIAKEISKPVKDLVKKALKMPNQVEKINHIRRMLNQIFTSIPQQAAREVSPQTIGLLILIVASIYLLFNHGDNRVVFDFAALTLRSIFGIISLLDDTMDCIRLTSLLGRAAGGDALKAANLASAVTRGAVAVFGIALDVTGIALASIDIHNGSHSPQAEKITELAEEMRNEATLFEELYETLSQ